jgi:hypothetical protein
MLGPAWQAAPVLADARPNDTWRSPRTPSNSSRAQRTPTRSAAGPRRDAGGRTDLALMREAERVLAEPHVPARDELQVPSDALDPRLFLVRSERESGARRDACFARKRHVATVRAWSAVSAYADERVGHSAAEPVPVARRSINSSDTSSVLRSLAEQPMHGSRSVADAADCSVARELRASAGTRSVPASLPHL